MISTTKTTRSHLLLKGISLALLLLILCTIDQSSAQTLVKFQRGQGPRAGESSFYEGTDQFENIVGKFSGSSHHKTEFCKSLNGVCFGHDCKMCYCRKNVPFISYNIGCRNDYFSGCLLYTSPSPRDGLLSRMPSSA